MVGWGVTACLGQGLGQGRRELQGPGAPGLQGSEHRCSLGQGRGRLAWWLPMVRACPREEPVQAQLMDLNPVWDGALSAIES